MMKLGYKGVSDASQGAYYAPNIPTGISQHRSWKSYLMSLDSRYIQWKKQGYKDTDGEADATELMKQHYPGNYKLVERFIPKRGVFGLDIVFDNPKEEMLWKIKWE